MRFWILPISLMVALLTAGAARGQVPEWDPDTLQRFSALPVQDGGRVKPLDTYASFKLLKLNGKRTFQPVATDARGMARMFAEKRSAVEWLLDVLFYPEMANTFPIFSINTSDVIVAIGLPPHSEKRDRYSFRELEPGMEKLFTLARQYANKDESARTAIERQILKLAQDVSEYDSLVHYAAFARRDFTAPEGSPLAAVLGGSAPVRLSDILRKAPEIERTFLATQADRAQAESGPFSELFKWLDEVRGAAMGPALFPASQPDDPQWFTPADLVLTAFQEPERVAASLDLLARFEDLARSTGDPAVFRATAAAFQEAVVGVATARGEFEKIELEVAFYQAKFFHRALIFYFVCFVLAMLSWLAPKSRLMHGVTFVSFLLPTVLLVAGITMRCIIRNRPPATTLYETVLFTTAVAAVLALIVEYATRRRVALTLGAVLGIIGLFLANKYEARDGSDTMPSMVAVLNTNFWLTAHVTTILMGYAAGLFSGAMAHVYVVARLLGLKKTDREFYSSFTRAVYGTFCFSFVFAVIGTLLGGIWANESWGRFWGWDPKENGALLIVLWQLAVLHARKGGYIRELGMHLSSIALGMVVAFSWWGVNLLGVGLHSYGFTTGTMGLLTLFWGFETFVLVLGWGIWLRGRTLLSPVR